jgi:hypothetical protein
LRPGILARPRMMRRVLPIGILLALLGTALPAQILPAQILPAHAADAAPDRPIAKFLPHKRNQKICFTATFGDGGIALAAPGGHLQSLTAELYWDDAEPVDYRDGGFGYDRRYEIMLMARTDAQREPMFGGLECPYRDRAHVDPKTGKAIDGPSATGLNCFQDCIGGSLDFTGDGKALVLVLDPKNGIRLGQDLKLAAPATRLRLEPAPAAMCLPIDKHYGD